MHTRSLMPKVLLNPKIQRAAVGVLSLFIGYSELSEDARDCSAKCNQDLVKCYYQKPSNDPGTKCDDQWEKCNSKCQTSRS